MKPFVLALVVLLFAGCVDDPNVAGDGSSTQVLVHESTVIAEDQYFASGFELFEAARLAISVEVHSGPNLDVFVMDSTNYQQFSNGNEFVHFPTCGGVAAQGFERSCNLGSGRYYMIIDNSDAGNTAPPWNGVDDGAHATWRATLQP